MGLVKFASSSLPILVDASFLVSIYDKQEPYHRQCMAVLDQVNQPLVTCEPVVTEAIYLLRMLPGAPEAILANIQDGQLGIPFHLAHGADKVLACYTKYRDTPCDFADACLIHMADQLDTGDILTLDSDFKHYRWRRTRSFRMLIPLE
jgi:predicted nucleic acid-binding protein